MSTASALLCPQWRLRVAVRRNMPVRSMPLPPEIGDLSSKYSDNFLFIAALTSPRGRRSSPPSIIRRIVLPDNACGLLQLCQPDSIVTASGVDDRHWRSRAKPTTGKEAAPSNTRSRVAPRVSACRQNHLVTYSSIFLVRDRVIGMTTITSAPLTIVEHA